MLAVYNRRNCFKRVASIADRACLASIPLRSVWNHTERKKKPTCRVNNKGGKRLVWEESKRITRNCKTNRDKIRTICGLVSVITDNTMRKRWYTCSLSPCYKDLFSIYRVAPLRRSTISSSLPRTVPSWDTGDLSKSDLDHAIVSPAEITTERHTDI